MVEQGTWLTLGLTLLATIVWAVRVEARSMAHEKLLEERKELADERYEDTRIRLNRIENHLLDIKATNGNH